MIRTWPKSRQSIVNLLFLLKIHEVNDEWMHSIAESAQQWVHHVSYLQLSSIPILAVI